MKTIIEEAIDSFVKNHSDRCLSNVACDHNELIKRAKNYERRIQKDLADDCIVQLEELRDDWLVRTEIKEGTAAAFIDLIFGIAIKFLKEIK